MPLKLTLLLTGLFCFLESIYSQNLIFMFTDGAQSTYSVNEIRNITFDVEVITVKKKDGTTVSWNVSSITNYRYDATTSVTQQEMINNAEVKIFPNPFKGSVHIRYELPSSDKISVGIFDLQGRIIHQWPLQQKHAGVHEIIWNTTETNGKLVPPGTYICRIISTKGSVSKMLVME